MAPVEEPDEERVKRYEELYRLAHHLYDKEIERYDAGDQKADRYVTIVVAFLAGSAFVLDRVFPVVREPDRPAHYVLLVAASLFYVSALGALIACVWSLAGTKLPVPPMGGELVKFFRSTRYRDAIYAQAKRFLEAAAVVRQRANSKFAAISLGFALLLSSLLVGSVGLATIAYIDATEVAMAGDEGDSGASESSSAPDPQDTPQGQSATPVEPSDSVEAPSFVSVQRAEVIPGADDEPSDLVEAPAFVQEDHAMTADVKRTADVDDD